MGIIYRIYTKTLNILRQHKVLIKTSKCDFGKQELEYLSHIMMDQGVKVDNKNWGHRSLAKAYYHYKIIWIFKLDRLL